MSENDYFTVSIFVANVNNRSGVSQTVHIHYQNAKKQIFRRIQVTGGQTNRLI